MSYKVKLRKHNPRGQVLGELGPFTTQKLALKQAQVVADRGDLADGILVTVEKTPKRRKNTPKSRTHFVVGQRVKLSPEGMRRLSEINAPHPKEWRGKITHVGPKGRMYWVNSGTSIVPDLGHYKGEWLKAATKPRKNTSSRSYKGHKIKGKTGNYTVDPYGYEFPTLKAAKAWLDKHVRDAYPKPKKATTKRRKNTKLRKNRAATVTYEVYTSRGGKGIRDTSGPFSKRQANKIAKEFVTTPSGVKMRKHPGGPIHKDFKRYGLDWAVVVPTASRWDWELQPALTTRKKLIGPTAYQRDQLGVVDFHPPHGNPKSHGPSCPCPKCNPAHPKVKIQRKGYKRKGYWMTTSTGKRTYVKPTYIAATEFKITDPGRPGVRSFGAKSAGEGYKANPPRKSKRPTKKEIEARRYMKPLITREGKLGGPGYTKRPVADRREILDKCVKQWGYRSCLGSLLVLLKNSAMKQRARGVITRDKNWLEEKYGGTGSFGPQRRKR